MKYIAILLSLFIFGCAVEYSGEYKLVFQDDFNGNSLNSNYWTAIERGLSWNSEDQAYSPGNVSVKDGLLIIESREERWSGPTNLPWHPDNHLDSVVREYTSGQVETKGKRSWKYGRFEIRAKMMSTPGMLNAIWMVPESGEWPPEIDIAEILGNEPTKLYMTSHYGTQEEHKMNSFNYQYSDDLSNEFHTYSVEWEPGVIRWYLDGKFLYETKNDVPDERFYLILCPAIGPEWTGDPDIRSIFPLKYEVDWVKVWQRR